MRLDPDDRRLMTRLFAAFWATYALIGPGFMVLNPNSVSRMGYVFTLLREGHAHIDALAAFTVDKAELAGHFYLDKAPGLSFMALPVVALYEWVAHALGGSGDLVAGAHLSLHYILATVLATVLTVAPAAAGGGAALFGVARLAGASREGALFAALVFGLATPAFGWSTVLFGHAAAGGFLLMGLYAVLTAARDGGGWRAGAVAGFLLAWSVVIEFPAAVPAALIGAVGLVRLPRATLAPTLAGVALGAGVAGAPLLAYNHLVFGAPFALGYSHVVGFEGMQRGLFGIVLPDPAVALALLVGAKRGLLPLSPILVLLPLAWFATRRWPADLRSLAIAIPLLLLGINAGYAYWDGGASTGPRHLVPALGFMALAFAPLWDASGRLGRAALSGLTGLSIAISALCAITAMGAPIWEDNPLPDYILPRFLSGDTHWLVGTIGDAGFAWLGLLLVPWVIAFRPRPTVDPAAATA